VSGEGGLPFSSVATLGGPDTFAGQATAALLRGLGSDVPVEYHPAMEAVWSALRSGEAEAILLTAESTHVGLTEVAAEVLRDPELSVLAEVVLPYHCALLGKPGAELRQVRRVTGHGSLAQCRGYLRRELPWAEVAVHRENSVVAAKEVLYGDGSVAVVGSLGAAERLGLAVLAQDVDGGSQGAWWVLGRGQPAADAGTTAVIGAKGGAGNWPAIGCEDGRWALRSLMVEPTGEGLHQYRTLAVWSTQNASESLTTAWTEVGICRGRFNTVTVK
jgi:prephenate dehydratase